MFVCCFFSFTEQVFTLLPSLLFPTVVFVLAQRLGELFRKLWNPRNFKSHVSPHEMCQVSVVSLAWLCLCVLFIYMYGLILFTEFSTLGTVEKKFQETSGINGDRSPTKFIPLFICFKEFSVRFHFRTTFSHHHVYRTCLA